MLFYCWALANHWGTSEFHDDVVWWQLHVPGFILFLLCYSKQGLITCTFCAFISNVVKRAPKNSRKQTLGGLSSSFCQKNSLWKGFVLTKPHSKSFSICPTILSKHHLLWTVLWKHLEKTGKAFIFLKQPTKEEIWSFKYSVNRCLS